MRLLEKLYRYLTHGADGVLGAGNPGLQIQASSSYGSPTSAHPRFDAWRPAHTSPNHDIYDSNELLLTRARERARQDPWARSIIDAFVSNAIGTGVIPRFRHPSLSIREKMRDLWDRSVEHTDPGGQLDFYGQQFLACKSALEGGDCFVLFKYVGSAEQKKYSLPVPLQLIILEAEHVPLHVFGAKNLEEGNYLKLGIEFTKGGRRAAYYMYETHPLETLQVGGRWGDNEPRRIPAVFGTNNSPQVLHHYTPARPGAVRGEPKLSGVLTRLFSLEDYDQAELARKTVSSKLTGVVRQTLNPGMFPGSEHIAPQNTEYSTMEPGTFLSLNPSEEVQVLSPKDVPGVYGEFVTRNLMALAAGAGIPYHEVTGDLTKVNYSSIRAGILPFRRKMEQFQYLIFIKQFCRPFARAWLDQAVASGAIALRNYDTQREKYLATIHWETPGWPWTDPLKDVKASVEAVKAGFTSRERVVAANGLDVEEIDLEQQQDKQRAKQRGLMHSSDAETELKEQPERDETQQETSRELGELD